MVDKSKEGLTRLRTRPGERNFALAKLGIGAGLRMAGHTVANLFRDDDERGSSDREFYIREAQRLAAELGSLKGSVMKAGQMLSLYAQYFMPPEAVEVLRGLQDDTVHVDWAVVEPVLRQALGPERLAELDITREPIAAASLGQAHRATQLASGQELCIKIRYPGVDQAIDSDVRTIARLIGFSRLVPSGLSLDPVFTEVREMLHREVDYVHEAEMTESFRQRLQTDPRFVVPAVQDRYSNSELLTMSFEAGESLNSAAVLDLPQARRNALGAAFLELFLREFFSWNLVQTDPHFGNYRIRPGGAEPRIVLLDFGATRRFPKQFVGDYGEIVSGALRRDRQRVIRGASGIGLMQHSFPESVLDGFYELCRLIVEPFSMGQADVPPQLFNASGCYLWAQSDLPQRVTMTIARTALTRHFTIPPREIVFLHRRLAGVFILLAHLGVELDGRELIRRYLPD